MAYKTLAQTIDNVYPAFITQNKSTEKKSKKLELVLNQLQEKN